MRNLTNPYFDIRHATETILSPGNDEGVCLIRLFVQKKELVHGRFQDGNLGFFTGIQVCLEIYRSVTDYLDHGRVFSF